MRLVDLTTKPWQLMLPGEKETSLNKMVYLPGTLDEFGVGHEDRLDNSCHPDETTAQSFDDDVIATRFTRKHTYKVRHILSRKLRLHQQINAALSLRLSEPDVCVFI